MTSRSVFTRTSQAANLLLALSLLLALVHFRWSLTLFAAGCVAHALLTIAGVSQPEPEAAAVADSAF